MTFDKPWERLIKEKKEHKEWKEGQNYMAEIRKLIKNICDS